MKILIKQWSGVLVSIPLSVVEQPGDTLDEGDIQMAEAIAKAMHDNNYMSTGYYDVELVGSRGDTLSSVTLVV